MGSHRAVSAPWCCHSALALQPGAKLFKTKLFALEILDNLFLIFFFPLVASQVWCWVTGDEIVLILHPPVPSVPASLHETLAKEETESAALRCFEGEFPADNSRG